MERTRRLFSTLNRRAKPTSSGMNIAIDEDDTIAIITRRLVKENPYLKKLVLSNVESINSKQLSPTKKNDSYITTLAALYECNEILISGKGGGTTIDKEFKQFRKPYQAIDEYYNYVEQLWVRMIEKCPGFDQVLSGSRKAGELRQKRTAGGGVVLDDKGKPTSGSSVFARPMGQYVICEVVRNATIQGKSAIDTIDAVMANLPLDIDERPWAGVTWNSSTHTIQGSSSERRLLVQIICYSLGIKIPVKQRDLLQSYRNIVENQKATFPLQSISWIGSARESDETEQQ